MSYCQNCGHVVSKDQKFCEICGESLSTGAANYSTSPSTAWKIDKRSMKVLKIMLGIIFAAVILTFIVIYQSGIPQKMVIKRQLSLGEEYLDAKDFENARQVFEKLQSADPKNQRVYLGLAEACEGLGDFDSAQNILQTGYQETDSEAIMQRLFRMEEKIEKQEAFSQEKSFETDSAPVTETRSAITAPDETKVSIAAPESKKDLRKSISAYLEKLLTWEIPFPKDFASISQLDKNWVIQRFALGIENATYFPDASTGVLLKDIEALAQRDINPDFVLPDDGDYSGLEEGTVENGYYKWFGRGGRNFQFIPYLQDVRQEGDTYVASVVEVASVSEGQFWPNGEMRLYLQDQDTKRWDIPVGTQRAQEGFMPLNFTVDIKTLPVCEYIIKDNGSGGFYLLSKKSQGLESKMTDEALLKAFRQRHPEFNDIIDFVSADFDKDNEREMFLCVKNNQFPDEPFPYGDLWYLDGNGAEYGNLQKSLGFVTEGFSEDSMRVVKCQGKPFLSLQTTYPMGGYAHVLGVVNGVPVLEINDGSMAHAKENGQYLKTALILLPNEKEMQTAGEFIPPHAGYGMPEYYGLDNQTGRLVRIPAEKITDERLLKYEGAEETLKLIESILLNSDNSIFGEIVSFSRESIIRRGNAAIGINYLCVNKSNEITRKYAVCEIEQGINGKQELAYPVIYWGAMKAE